jgi:hypothetical protein
MMVWRCDRYVKPVNSENWGKWGNPDAGQGIAAVEATIYKYIPYKLRVPYKQLIPIRT